MTSATKAFRALTGRLDPRTDGAADRPEQTEGTTDDRSSGDAAHRGQQAQAIVALVAVALIVVVVVVAVLRNPAMLVLAVVGLAARRVGRVVGGDGADAPPGIGIARWPQPAWSSSRWDWSAASPTPRQHCWWVWQRWFCSGSLPLRPAWPWYRGLRRDDVVIAPDRSRRCSSPTPSPAVARSRPSAWSRRPRRWSGGRPAESR